MLLHVGVILSAATLLLIATNVLSTTEQLKADKGDCSVNYELNIAANVIDRAKKKLSEPQCATSSCRDSCNDITAPPDLCNHATIDAITRTLNGATYAFRGRFYWKIWEEPLTHGIANEKARRISEDWEDLPENLDAALTLKNGTTYFFKGSYYWSFVNKVKVPGYPKLIRNGFPGVPDSPDAAFVWGGDNSVYFFKDNKYYQLYSEGRLTVKQTGLIKEFKDLPPYVDAALRWDNGVVYVFKCDVYYRLDDSRRQVYTGYYYPKQSAETWRLCAE